MDDIRCAIDAATLLGRWIQVAERHGRGCSCCPSLGDVGMDTVERSVLDYLRERHPILDGRDSLVGMLRECVERRPAPDPQALAALFDDLGRAIDDLERIQSGMR